MTPTQQDKTPESANRVQDTDDGWRPIESAPTDGAVFHVWADGFEWPEAVKWEIYPPSEAEEVGEAGYWTYAETLMAEVTDDCGSEDWTHWRRLPAPPESQALIAQAEGRG